MFSEEGDHTIFALPRFLGTFILDVNNFVAGGVKCLDCSFMIDNL